tara:strand:+ start:7429 stop:9945 length:2517 start_codon:yes stop_codon:yes gene_type:complete
MLGKALKTGIGGVGGALMGGAGLIGAGLISATGAGKYVAGAAAIGAGAKAGANWLGNKSFGGDKNDKNDPKEELNKVSEIGLLSVEKLDAIYDNVLDLRKFFAGQDPVAQEREKALDEKVKNKELVNAIRGMGGGKGGGGGKGLGGFDWKSLLLLGGLGSLAFLDGDDLKNFIEKLPGWIENIDEAIDNIMEFVKDLDNFFEGLGIEFAGAAIMGTSAGMKRGRRIGGRPGGAPKRNAYAEGYDKRKADKAKAERLAKRADDRAKARAARAEAAKARAAAKAAEKAKIKEEARKARTERTRQRAQRLKTAAAKIKARYTASMSRIGGRPGGAPVKPSTTTARTKTSTPKRGPGRIKRGFGTAFKVMQGNKARVQQALLDERAETKRLAKESRAKRRQDRVDRIKRSAAGMRQRIQAKIASVRTPTDKGGPRGKIAAGGNRLFKIAQSAVGRWTGMGQQTGDAYKKPPKISTPKRGPGRIKRGFAALTPIAKNIFGGRSTGMGGRPLSDFPEIKPITQGAGRGRPGGAPTKPAATTASKFSMKGIGDMAKQMFGREGTAVKGGSVIPGSTMTNTRSRPSPPKQPKIPPKLTAALSFLPRKTINLALKLTGATGTTVAKGLLRAAGPLIAAYEIGMLTKAWWDADRAPMNLTPFGNDDKYDKIWQDGMMHLAATYTGAHFGAMVGSVLGTMVFPGVGTIVGGGIGGISGAIMGSTLYKKFTQTDQEKIDEKRAKWQSLYGSLGEGQTRNRAGDIVDYNPETASPMQKRFHNQMMKNKIQLENEIRELQNVGPVDDIDAVVVIQNSDNSSHSVSSQTIGTTIQTPESYNPVPIFGATSGYR